MKPKRKAAILRYLLPVPGLALALLLLVLLPKPGPNGPVAAHSGDVFGPACGAATVNGEVDASEWSSAAAQTFAMQSGGSAPALTATLHVMNGANNLFLGITINDDEFSTVGEFLSGGDSFRIDFDNAHSGSIFVPGDDVLVANAGFPQFEDSYIDADPVPSSSEADVNAGGTTDGAAATSRLADLNHFEIRHPLCSGDPQDFCLYPGDTVGFRLEYLDAEEDGSFGGSRFFPGSTANSVADIVIGTCATPDLFFYLPLILK